MNAVKATARAVLTLLAVAVVLAVGIVVIWLLRDGLKRVFDGTDPSVASAIAAGVFALVVTVASILLTRRHERQRAIEEQIRERKAPVYEELVRGLLSLLGSAGPDGEVDADAARELLKKVTPDLIIWASDAVVLVWSRWQRDLNLGALEGMEVTFAFESILRTIRRDLGHGNVDFERGDLLRLFVSDVETYLPVSQAGR